MTQYARPDSDISNDNWEDDGGGSVNLYQTIDETTASESDYLISHSFPSNDIYEAGLSDVTDPVSSVGHTVLYRYKKSAADGAQMNITVRLMQGTTIIASKAVPNISEVWTDNSFALTGGEADSITDYTDLRLQFEAIRPGSGQARGVLVSWAELQVPDAGTPAADFDGADLNVISEGIQIF